MTTPPGFDPNNPQGQPFYPPQGQPYPPPHYPAAPAPTKKSTWKWILGVVVGLIVIGALMPKDTVKETQSAPATMPSMSMPSVSMPAAPKADDVAPVGTKVRDGKFEFSVDTVEGGSAVIGDNPFFQKKAQGQWVVATVKVTNVSDKPQSFVPSAQKMIDAQGRNFVSDATAQMALGGSDVPVWDNINPGNTANVKLVYDMPPGAVPAMLELHDSMFSGGVKVKVAP